MSTITRIRVAPFAVAALLAAGGAGACAPVVTAGPPAARGVPGFDTRDYPGDPAMRSWFDASPYRWVGYYLPAPCYTGTTWSGRRDVLRAMGWGFAVLFVGEQDWSAMHAAGDTAAATDTVAAAPGTAARCVSANLTAEQGAVDARAAMAAAAADGFPEGTVIFLNVERVERVRPALTAYIRSWFGTLLESGRYAPGLYAHGSNAAELYVSLETEYRRHGRSERAPLWLAHQEGFDVNRAPAESGYPVAAIWQGRFDTAESWDGVTLNIDVNVADSSDPSGGR